MIGGREHLPEVLRARLLAAAAARPATPPGAWGRRGATLGAAAAAWIIGFTGVVGVRRDWEQLPATAWGATLLALVGTAAVTSGVALARGRTLGGIVGGWSATGLPAALALLVAVVSILDPRGAGAAGFEGPALTLARAARCDLLVVAMALPLVAVGWAMIRGLTLARPGWSGAWMGLAAATWAHAVVRVHCPAGGAAHGLIGHLLPAVPLMALGAWTFASRGRRPA